MGYKIAVFEITGMEPGELQTQLQSVIDGLTIAAGSEPSVTVVDFRPRRTVFVLYRDA